MTGTLVRPLFGGSTNAIHAIDRVEEPAKFNAPSVSRSKQMPALDKISDLAVYATDATAKISKFNDEILSEIKTSELDVFEEHVTEVLTLAKGFTLPKEKEDTGFFSGLLNKAAHNREKLMGKFTSVRDQIENVSTQMSTLVQTYMNRNETLDQMYQLNMEEYDNLEQYIKHAESVLKEKNAEANAFKAAITPGDMLAAQQFNDMQSFINRLEKMIDNRKRIQMLAIQTAPDIRRIQDNNYLLIEKFGDLETLALPAWKKNFTLYLCAKDQRKGVNVANAIDDATNDFLKATSDILNENSVDIYRASQRSVVDIETLEYVQNNMIASFNSIKTITAEGQQARKDAAIKMEKMKQTYLELATQS